MEWFRFSREKRNFGLEMKNFFPKKTELFGHSPTNLYFCRNKRKKG